MSPQGSLHFEVLFEKNRTEASDLFLFLFTCSWSKRPSVFTYNTNDLRVLFYHLWIDFYSVNDDCSKKIHVHRPPIFIFCRFTWVRKRCCKKENKNYGKADTESKIAIKKDGIQSSDESIQPYEDEQRNLQEKLQKLNEKQQDLAMKWKKSGGRKGD